MRLGVAHRIAIAVFLGCTLVYGLCSAFLPIYTKGEAREAIVARAVAEGNGWLVPRRPDGLVPAKPPLFHWLAAAALASGLGPAELAVRVPSVVLGAAAVALTAAAVVPAYGARTALVAAVLLASSAQWLRAATESRVDMTLTFFMVLAALSWRRGLAGDRRWPVHVGHAAAALAVLAKGPVGALLPALAVGVDAVVAGERARLRRLLGWSAVLAAAACIGWYAAALAQGGSEFSQRQLLHENLYRFLGIGRVEHAHSMLYYPPVLAAGLLPAILALPLAIRRLGRDDLARLRFPLVAAAVVLAFYSLARGKRGVYLLPLYPAAATLLAVAVARALATARARPARALALAAGVAAFGLVVCAPGVTAWLARLLTPALDGSDASRLPFAVAVLGRQRAAIAVALAALGAAAGALVGARSARVRVAALAGLAAVWALGLNLLGTRPLALALAPREFAGQVRGVIAADDPVCALGDVPDSFRFYLHRALPRCRAICRDTAARGFAVRRASYVAGAAERCLRSRLVETRRRSGEPLELLERRTAAMTGAVTGSEPALPGPGAPG